MLNHETDQLYKSNIIFAKQSLCSYLVLLLVLTIPKKSYLIYIITRKIFYDKNAKSNRYKSISKTGFQIFY